MDDHHASRHVAPHDPAPPRAGCTVTHDVHDLVHSLIRAARGATDVERPPEVALTRVLLDAPGVLVALGSELSDDENLAVLDVLERRGPGTGTRVLVPSCRSRAPLVRAGLTALAATGTVRLRVGGSMTALGVVTSDGTIALQPRGSAATSLPTTAARSALASLLESLWSVAVDLECSDEPLLSGERHDAVLRMLVDGTKDETAARALNVSVRTYRRYVAQILDELGATSRFQAGVRAARTGRATG